MAKPNFPKGKNRSSNGNSPSPNNPKVYALPTKLLKRVPIEIVRTSITPGLESVSGGLPKKYLEIGDILKFDYFDRTKYKNLLPCQIEQNISILNPIVICIGFDMTRIHVIDLSILNIFYRSSEIEITLYRNYTRKYYKGDKRNDISMNDINSFNPKAINGGVYGDIQQLCKCYRSYNFNKMGGRHVTIINIYQAEKEAGMGHKTAPVDER